VPATLATVLGVAQILFYAIVATVTALTYRHARRTIFQPIRTEIFKEQLRELTKVLSLFAGKGESELRTFLGLDKAFAFNAHMMYDHYAQTFFDRVIDRKRKPYSECAQSMIHKDYLLKHFKLVDEDKKDVPPDAASEPPDPRVRAALWSDYTHGETLIPAEVLAAQEQMTLLRSSPLLPMAVLTALEGVDRVFATNLRLVGETLTSAAKEMPQRYPAVRSMSDASFAWLRNRYISSFTDVEPPVRALLDAIREYCGPDALTSDLERLPKPTADERKVGRIQIGGG
jgi:hypothetical protein